MRPRGWHLPEKHLSVDGEPVGGRARGLRPVRVPQRARAARHAAAVRTSTCRRWRATSRRGSGTTCSLTEDELGLERGTIRATVLIETVPAAFEMDEILYELREHSAGLNAGRWDYIFSVIKRFRTGPEFVLPDRNERDDDGAVHARLHRAAREDLPPPRRARDGRHGGVDPQPHRRGGQQQGAGEAARGQAARGRRRLRRHLGRAPRLGGGAPWRSSTRCSATRPNQVDRRATTSRSSAAELLDVAATPGEITEDGLRNDVNVGIQYISSWLRGNGAAAIYGLMEDAATAEIARSQVWQWVRHGAELTTASRSPPSWCKRIEDEELEKIRAEIGDDEWFETRAGRRESRDALRGGGACGRVRRVLDAARRTTTCWSTSKRSEGSTSSPPAATLPPRRRHHVVIINPLQPLVAG